MIRLKRLTQLPYGLCFNRQYFSVLAILLFIFDTFLSIYVVNRVKYTEIDWIAYMQEVEGFLNGTLNYTLLKGQTGPLVYPAGFVYFYALLYHLSSAGSNIKLVQYFFILFYLLNLFIVFKIYKHVEKVPPYVFIFMCCTSYRVHSIYILRLFNDPIAMLFFYGSVYAVLSGHTTFCCVLFSVALSIKMNILLFAPGLLIVLLYQHGIWETIGHLCEIAVLQLLLGLPFLAFSAPDYFHRAFNFGRQFLFKWTVNWRFLPVEIFENRIFHLNLLILHVLFLVLLLHLCTRRIGGYRRIMTLAMTRRTPLESDTLLLLLFGSNFVGMVFSRSLHYQFYVWYYHTLPFLLWTTPYPIMFRLLLWGLIEMAWNTYPSTVVSSLMLHACHAFLLVGILYTVRQPRPQQAKKCD